MGWMCLLCVFGFCCIGLLFDVGFLNFAKLFVVLLLYSGF